MDMQDTKRWRRRTLLAASALAAAGLATGGRARAADGAASAAAAAADAERDSVAAEVAAIVARFVARAQPVLPGLAAPKVVVSFTPQLSWIEDDGSAIHTVAWGQCPPPMQSFFAGLLGTAPAMPPARFFHEVFDAFLVPHEMSHFVDARRGQLRNGGQFYRGEVHANRVAVAFWLGEPGGRERIGALMAVVADALARLPGPVPAGEDRVAYFDAHYTALLDDASKYGWYQFRMFLDAWERREEAGFETLLRTPLL